MMLRWILFGAALAAAPGVALATPGDRTLPEQRTHYGYVGARGGGDELAIVSFGVGDAAKFETDFNDMRALLGEAPCTRANFCLSLVNQTGGSTLPTDSPSDRHDAALAAAMIALAAPDSPIRIVSCGSKTGTTAKQAIATVIASPSAGFLMGFGLSSTDPAQGQITTMLSGSGVVAVAPQGFLTAAISIGATQYTTSAPADAAWTGTAATLYSVGRQVPAIADGSAVVVDSLLAPAGAILGRLENQTGGIADLADVTGASSSHFVVIPGTSGRGRFVDHSDL